MKINFLRLNFKIKNYLAVFLLIHSHYQLSHLAIHNISEEDF